MNCPKLLLCVLLLACNSLSHRLYAQADAAPRRQSLPDPLKARSLNPNFDLYPDSSLADFSSLLTAPAGSRGFVTTDADGHFHFKSDASRARFWGVTITQEHIDIPKRRIDEVVDVLARAGCNMVRFHSLDNRAGLQYGFLRRTIIDETPPHENDTQHLDSEYLDRLDYWIARLKERGIYTYLVLRGFRHYLPGDDVHNALKLPRGATPMAIFNERLIELQIQYARNLLATHRNPYTKLNYASDPAIALIEVFNEDSLFARPRMWQEMIEPYRTEFHKLWIDYLRRSYKTTVGLRQAWTNVDGLCALQTTETFEAANILLPDMNANQTFEQAQAEPFTHPLKSPTRRRDGVRFAIELQRKYFRRMMDALHAMGVRVPCTGVVAGKSIPDTYSAACEFDFTAENMYQEHPEYEPGRDWLPPAYYHDTNYLTNTDPSSGVPFVARYKWAGKPLAVREWATCWPNQYRAASMMEMASYGRMQDWDCILYFAYFTTGDFTRLSSFALNNDPARWSLFGPAAQVFLSPNSIAPAAQLVHIGYSDEDMYAYSSWEDPLHTLAWKYRVQNVHLPAPIDQLSNLVPSGRSKLPFYLSKKVDAAAEQSMSYGLNSAAFKTLQQQPVPGAVTRDTNSANMKVDTPTVQVAQGITTGGLLATSQLTVQSSSPFAAVTALSLDDQPLSSSQRYLVKQITVAENRKQLLESSKNPAMKNMKVMVTEGTTPIVTRADYDTSGTRITLNGKELVHAQMFNGTWELLVDDQHRTAYLYCDLPNAEFTIQLPGAQAYQLIAHPDETSATSAMQVPTTFKYPGWAKYAELRY
ncbi:MAG: hypothetical protein ACR2IE_12590 [Candidatus Sumerlaeaceae bacterium]